MTRPSRDFWLVVGLFVVLTIVTVATALWQARQETDLPPLASFSSAPDGGRALRLWLEELGYVVSDEVADRFQIPESATLVLVLEPITPISASEWDVIDAWVEDGGVLILAGDQWNVAQAAHHYDFDLIHLAIESSILGTQNPLLTSPPLTGSTNGHARSFFRTERDDFVAYLVIERGPVLLSFEHGAGQVILSAAPFLFSNAGLKEVGNPSLVLNVIAMAGQPGLVWFDEWHHGVRMDRAEVVGTWNWLRHTPAGRSLLFAAGVIFLALAIRGRRFGRPVPLPKELVRRASLEYITAIANLNRRAGHRSAVLGQYYHQVKRRLGQRYHLSPDLSDDEYLVQLATFNPNIDVDALGNLLSRLHQHRASERDLVQLAAEVADWLEEA